MEDADTTPILTALVGLGGMGHGNFAVPTLRLSGVEISGTEAEVFGGADGFL